MEPPVVNMLLLVVLCLTATLPGPTMGQAEGSNAPARPNANKTLGDNQISSLQRRQDLLDTRLTNLHTQLNTQKTEVNARLDRVDGRFDGIETRLSDMEEYLKIQLEAMGKKVELALGHANTKQQTRVQDQGHCLSYLLEKPSGDSTDFRPPRIPQVYQGCQDARAKGWKTSGIYTISPEQNMTMDVYCDQQIDGGGWTVFQARKDGSVDFYRTWNAYKSGFGDLRGEFWLGNTNIYLLTKHHDQELMVELTSAEGEVKYANYSSFLIEDEAQKYKLHVTGYTGGSPPSEFNLSIEAGDTKHSLGSVPVRTPHPLS